MSRKFLVTGGAGFIGSHLTEALVARGDSVRVIDNLCTGNIENLAAVMDRIEFIEADLCDADAVGRAVAGVDCIFHQAALASVPLSIEQPLDVNAACVTGSLTLLDQAQNAGVRRIIYAASSSLYGDRPFATNRETDIAMPLSPYAVAKLAAEYYCQAFYHTHGLETVALRYFNVFGPRQDPDSPYSAVIPIFITRLLADQAPIIFGDGEQTRDFTYIANIVHGNLLAADADANDVAGKSINLANGVSTSLLTMLNSLKGLLGVDIEPVHEEPRSGEVRHSMADITLARKLLNYEPQVDFATGLQRSIDYYKTAFAVKSE